MGQHNSITLISMVGIDLPVYKVRTSLRSIIIIIIIIVIKSSSSS